MWKFHKSTRVKEELPDRNAESRGSGRTILTWIERTLLVSGLALVIFYAATRVEGWLVSRDALKNFENAETQAEAQNEISTQSSASNALPNLAEALDTPHVDFTLWDQRRIKAYKQEVRKQPGVPLAVLRIPKIQLEAPLLDSTDDLTLNHAVGRIAGTSRPGEPGNIGIAGHRDGFFRGLKDVVVGDAIELRTLQGTATYIVDQIQIVSPRQVEVLRPTAVPSLTLVTCYPFYYIGSAPQRYIVTASLSQEKNGEAENLNLSAPTTASNSTRRKNMRLFKKASLFSKGHGVLVLALMALGTAAAQDSTVTTIAHGQPSFDTQVKNAEIVYVEGNDLVLKLESGRVEHLIVPDSDRFSIDGKEVSVHELVPGTKLTQTITTSTTPRYVSKVRTIEGKVWHVNAPSSVILSLPDNTNQVFNVPNDAKFTIEGKERTVFDLRKGMKIKATIVTDGEHSVVESNKLAFGQAPPITMPREVGVLLFLAPQHPQPTLASVEQPADVLPETGSPLPLMGLMGALAVAMSAGLRVVRQTRSIRCFSERPVRQW
jgi:sortase A